MGLDSLAEPMADDGPCGPDLNARMDPDFDAYYFAALGRLPDAYARPGVTRPDGSVSPDRVFDPGSLDLAGELRQIDALLERSRDLRLLALRVQWLALAGRVPALAETLETVALLLERFPREVHPGAGSDPAERREALAELAAPATVIQPLAWAGLAGTAEVTLRKLRVAAGQATPLQGESGLSTESLTAVLADPGNGARLTRTLAALDQATAAVTRIVAACAADPEAPFTPHLDPLTAVLDEMRGAIVAVRPDLAAPVPMPETAAPEPVPHSAPVQVPPPTRELPAGAPEVRDQDHARRLLEACEAYYRRAEPSSPALLLVTQARLLIGRPLIEALEVLMPGRAAEAQIGFGPETGFVLDSARLRSLTEEGGPGDPAPARAESTLRPPPPAIDSAEQAAGTLRAVEDHFRRTERSSPVPMLLERAQAYLGKDFPAILRDLLPSAEGGR
ncbi:type VI secretion system ImpA family N-terminal domain-containing protein [Rhodovulum sulfidophilum]|uniref:type VI secretion system protein TssA n=1 Tax=Rhodovulum sulfidophilum TaxID=35806 RepID=UPI00192498A9|nr:type VI secretion system ImpA family N-terminal domain-containing protein [Rhodovulum sulfidophilum]MBL3574139.1 type VI secretion system ImpA family N-terminal domain-containing protein [Rhodovulum sulfidophilum]MCE8431810.1 type VI secretion system ImpA family N-terminal domain-containing protein [Rhodovulum sulfidophilum]MCF4119296.1 type VI secretion system ImpA family N-terminal domain-containing protein [Rhodovulum sulfidophilum]